MNIEEYISSGILESYVLGQTSEQENALITCLIKTNPLVAEEVRLIQESFELLAQEASISPPKELKDIIWGELEKESSTESTPEAEGNVISLVRNHTESQNSGRQESVIQLSWMKYAASFALIILSSFFAFYFYLQNKDMSQRLAQLEKNTGTLKQSEKVKQEYIQFLASNQTEKIILTGVPEKPNAKALVFWNKKNKHVMLSEVSLPETPKNMQYQLWAIVDGKPVDAGMLDLDAEGKLMEMKTIESSQAFAITLEPMGGSASPHLEDLCVIGNVK